jgi:carboxylesterase type B
LADGGFLQFGNPNDLDLRALLSDSPTRCIIVAPAYRLNLFGFLASPELLDACPDYDVNLGFWDQRLALQWTYENISYFGGNPANITVGGYSAGAHSAFHQVAYDLGVPENKAIVKRAMLLSNGPGMQPKSLEETQLQFNELLSALEIPLSLAPAAKLSRLRALDAKTLIQASATISQHQFRAVTDGAFVRHNLLAELENGSFAAHMQRRRLTLLMGECADEHFVYGTWRPPAPGYGPLQRRLEADYPRAASAALMAHYFPAGALGTRHASWRAAFGHVYADVQIHALGRGLARALERNGAADLLLRYRIEWRAACVDRTVPRKFGVTHTSDMAIWFWGNGAELSSEEKKVVAEAFHEPLSRFLRGEDAQWGVQHGMLIRTLKQDGRVVVEEDESKRAEEGLGLWDALKRAGALGRVRESRL